MSLNATTLKGMWAGLPVPWTDQDQVDESVLRENVRRICRVGAHGVYTYGTTGEFYAQTTDEWVGGSSHSGGEQEEALKKLFARSPSHFRTRIVSVSNISLVCKGAALKRH
jgi:hypothetical protein